MGKMEIRKMPGKYDKNNFYLSTIAHAIHVPLLHYSYPIILRIVAHNQFYLALSFIAFNETWNVNRVIFTLKCSFLEYESFTFMQHVSLNC